MNLACFQRLPYQFLDVPDLALQSAARSLAAIDLDGTRDALAIGQQGLVAAFDHGKDFVPFALQRRPHRMQPVVQAALCYDFQAASDIRRDALSLSQRSHAEI